MCVGGRKGRRNWAHSYLCNLAQQQMEDWSVPEHCHPDKFQWTLLAEPGRRTNQSNIGWRRKKSDNFHTPLPLDSLLPSTYSGSFRIGRKLQVTSSISQYPRV